MPKWIADFLRHYETRGLPQLSLTGARTALFGFHRWDYHGGGYGEPGAAELRCLRALADRIRELVSARERGQSSPGGTPMSIEDGIMDAYERLLEEYARWGGYRAHGWTDFTDTRNFQGRLVWSEADCALRYAMELEREFPHAVHAELAIGKATRADYHPETDKRQRIDLVVSDLADFEEDETSFERFRNLRHGAFIEVKWLAKGWRGNRFERDAIKRVASVHADVERLQRHLSLGRCHIAAVLVVDDEEYFGENEHLGGTLPEVGPDVWRLMASPTELERRGLLERDWTRVDD